MEQGDVAETLQTHLAGDRCGLLGHGDRDVGLLVLVVVVVKREDKGTRRVFIYVHSERYQHKPRRSLKRGNRVTSTASSGRSSGSTTEASGDAVPCSATSSTAATACGVTGVAGGCGDRLPRPSRFSREGDLPRNIDSVGERFPLRSGSL